MKPQKNKPVFSSALLFCAAAAQTATLTGILAHSAEAQTTVFGFTPNAYGVTGNAASSLGTPGSAGTGTPSSYSLGYAFTANTATFVTSLGYFNDPSYDPINDPIDTVSLSPEPNGTYTYASNHQVGLYQVIPATPLTGETGLLLGQTTITSASTPGGDFLYNAIAPITLIAGDQYVLAGVSGSKDPYVYNIEDDTEPSAIGLTVDPAITYDESRYTVSATLAYADSNDGSTPGFFGPNFQISSTLPASAAPEPGEWSALGLAALGLGVVVLRVRRRAAAK